jgi:hypothetical protein
LNKERNLRAENGVEAEFHYGWPEEDKGRNYKAKGPHGRRREVSCENWLG